MQQTSMMAWFSLENINAKQLRILNVLVQLQPACNLDVSEAIGWPINRVTPRMGELVKKGLVEEHHRALSKTGRTAIYWAVK